MRHSVRNINYIQRGLNYNIIPVPAPEDCASRKAIRDDDAESIRDGSDSEESAKTHPEQHSSLKPNTEVDSGEEMADEEWRKAMNVDEDDSDGSGDLGESDKAEQVAMPAISQYELDKAKNIAQLKVMLENVKKAYPMPEATTKPAKSKGKPRKVKESVEKRVSTRKRYA